MNPIQREPIKEIQCCIHPGITEVGVDNLPGGHKDEPRHIGIPRKQEGYISPKRKQTPMEHALDWLVLFAVVVDKEAFSERIVSTVAKKGRKAQPRKDAPAQIEGVRAPKFLENKHPTCALMHSL